MRVLLCPAIGYVSSVQTYMNLLGKGARSFILKMHGQNSEVKRELSARLRKIRWSGRVMGASMLRYMLRKLFG